MTLKMTNLNKNPQKDLSPFSNESQVGECASFWVVSGPPFDQRDYMISPSESASVLSDKSPSSAKKNKLRPCDIKIDSKYQLNSQKALRKLVELIRDGCAEHLINRIRDLTSRFLLGSPKGFLVEDLPSVIEVIEYFSRNQSSCSEYSEFVLALMMYAKEPPKMGKSSDMLHCKKTIKDYFTLFGELLASTDDECFQLLLLQALDGLITRRTLVDLHTIKLSFCHEAMEESQLPFAVAALMLTVSHSLYPYYLDLALQMILVSPKAGYVMIQNMALNSVLLRLDPNYYGRTTYKEKEFTEELENEDELNEHYRVLDKASRFIWGLLNIISKYDTEVPCPGGDCLWSLKSVFLQEIRRNTHKSINVRNNLAGVIIKLCAIFGEKLQLVQTGLAAAISKLAVATEINYDEPWLKNVKFGTTAEDYIFKKLMLLGCCFLKDHKNSVEKLKCNKVIEGVLRLINKNMLLPWSPTQFLGLLLIALRTTSELAPILPEDFVKSKGNARLLANLKWLMEEHFDQDLLLEGLKTFCAVVTCENNKCIIEDIKEQKEVKFLIELCLYLLNVKSLKIEKQEKLSRVFVILEKLLMNDLKLAAEFAESCVSISLKLFRRVLADLNVDSKWIPKLLISFVGFLWEAVAWCSSSLNFFIEQGGIFLLLDLIESSSYPVQMLLLGVLVDMTDQGETVAHLITWRGKDGYGILSMMIDIWRKEEIMNKVHRTKSGFIQEVENPLMSEEQWFLTHQLQDALIFSPSIAEMVCSARPKIHALYQFLQMRHFVLTGIGEDSYCLQLKVMKSSHQVYLPLVEHFLALKMGEVWFEVIRDANISGVIPTSFDGELLFKLIDEKNKWGARIKTLQEEIMLLQQKGDFNEENQLYKFLRSCRLSTSLEALEELDYIARTSFHKFQKQKKEKQIQEIDKSLEGLPFIDDIHRTFLYKTNATCLSGINVWIKSEKEVKDNAEDICLVSSESSEDNYFDYSDI